MSESWMCYKVCLSRRGGDAIKRISRSIVEDKAVIGVRIPQRNLALLLVMSFEVEEHSSSMRLDSHESDFYIIRSDKSIAYLARGGKGAGSKRSSRFRSELGGDRRVSNYCHCCQGKQNAQGEQVNSPHENSLLGACSG